MRLTTSRGLVLAAVALATLMPAADAQELKLPSVFGDHMVLQREMPVPVWGWGKAGETVAVSFGDQSKSTEATSICRAPITAATPLMAFSVSPSDSALTESAMCVASKGVRSASVAS